MTNNKSSCEDDRIRTRKHFSIFASDNVKYSLLKIPPPPLPPSLITCTQKWNPTSLLGSRSVSVAMHYGKLAERKTKNNMKKNS